MSRAWVEGIRSLLEAPAPAVLTTYRQDGSAHTVPVWFRSARAAIAGRYLGVADAERFAAERRSRPGVLLRLVPDSPRVWDLSGILPA